MIIFFLLGSHEYITQLKNKYHILKNDKYNSEFHEKIDLSFPSEKFFATLIKIINHRKYNL